ncbi:helix-turn-helix transcriptional regulator [Alicyclobacillus cellulosilyticus]|nr:AraC family transcriptional regulator [Alicyclobacillus cellulosilyticus]
MLLRRLSAEYEEKWIVGVGHPVQGLAEWQKGWISSWVNWGVHQASGGQGDGIFPARGADETWGEREKKGFRLALLRGDAGAARSQITASLSRALLTSPAHFARMVFRLLLEIEEYAVAAGVDLQPALQLWLQPDRVWRMYSVQSASDYLMSLVNEVLQEVANRVRKVKSSEALAADVRRFLEENYMYDLTLQDVAERYHYNVSYFAEVFRRATGKTFVEYLTEIRMRHAAELLRDESISLASVAELTGFASVSYFSSKFKRCFGVTPSEYRRKLQS